MGLKYLRMPMFHSPGWDWTTSRRIISTMSYKWLGIVFYKVYRNSNDVHVCEE